jgi:rfaE bifunctional protein nucleotidyltransferase chain/domain
MATATTTTRRERVPMNGVNTPTLFATIGAVREQPELAQFKFRASNKWQKGTYSRSQQEAYTGAGGTHEPGGFQFDSDHPQVLCGGLNSDASVRRLKGADRPVNPCSDRAELLAGLACVDFVVEFDADTPLALIQELLPDVLVKGMDWKDKGVVGREVVEARGGQVVLVDLLEGRSTTGIVERIRGGSFRAESGRP